MPFCSSVKFKLSCNQVTRLPAQMLIQKWKSFLKNTADIWRSWYWKTALQFLPRPEWSVQLFCFNVVWSCSSKKKKCRVKFCACLVPLLQIFSLGITITGVKLFNLWVPTLILMGLLLHTDCCCPLSFRKGNWSYPFWSVSFRVILVLSNQQVERSDQRESTHNPLIVIITKIRLRASLARLLQNNSSRKTTPSPKRIL